MAENGKKVTTTTESLEAAIKALDKYISDVKLAVKKMADAATDCSDNMERDKLSLEALKRVRDCIATINQGLKQAEEEKAEIKKDLKNTVEAGKWGN